MTARPAITRNQVGPDDPLRLDDAAAIAFPGGTMTASGLRKERDAGRLVVERIAGKDFTTLRAIANMRTLCRVERSHQGSTSASGATAQPSGSSSTAAGRSAQARVKLLASELKRRSRRTSGVGTSRSSATVIPLVSK